jgi:transcriptional regulator with XRE-family HTH domain
MERLADLRRARGLTQEQLAQKMGCVSRTVAGWEAGTTPRPLYLKRLARVLGVKADEIEFGRGEVE